MAPMRMVGPALLLCLLGCTGDGKVATEIVPFVERPLDVESSQAPDPTPEQATLKPALMDVPRNVKLGNDLRYVVELRNESNEDISLNPCPAFYQAWGESGTAYFGPGYLNCEDAPSIVPADGAVRFRMVLQLPDADIDGPGSHSFTGTIVWYLGGSGNNTEAAFSKNVTVSRDA
jgi:hypothetical protein